MSENVGALCSPTVLFYAGVVAAMSIVALLIALYGEMKVLAWPSAALSVASTVLVAGCFWRVLGAG